MGDEYVLKAGNDVTRGYRRFNYYVIFVSLGRAMATLEYANWRSEMR